MAKAPDVLIPPKRPDFPEESFQDPDFIYQMATDLTMPFASLCYFAGIVCGMRFHPLQKLWAKWQAEHQRSLILGPRNFGKSEVDTYYVLQRTAIDPNLRYLLLSLTEDKAIVHLRKIRRHLEYNETFRWIFGDLRGERWTDTELEFKGRTEPHGEATISATGVGGGLVVSQHYDGVMADDILTGESSRTLGRRTVLKEWWYNDFVRVLFPWSVLHVKGTRWHREDQYRHLMLNDFRDTTLITVALDPLTDRSTWEGRFPTEYLYQERRNNPRAFEAQMQQRIEDIAGGPFKREWARQGVPNTENMRIFIGIDPASGDSARSSFFACVVLGLTRSREVFVLEAYEDRLDFKAQKMFVRDIYRKWKKFPWVKVLVEGIGYHKVLGEATTEEYGIPVNVLTSVADPLSRVVSIADWGAAGRLWFTYGQTAQTDLVDQLVAFDPEAVNRGTWKRFSGETFDLLDAMSVAMTGISEAPRSSGNELAAIMAALELGDDPRDRTLVGPMEKMVF